MANDIQERFERAGREVTELSQAPDNLTKLRLYAFFKQGKDGDCTGARPGMLDMVGRAKYDAWKGLEGTSQDDAKQQYVDLVEELKAADAK